MDSQPQNPEFRNNPENFHRWISTEISCTGPNRVWVYDVRMIWVNTVSRF